MDIKTAYYRCNACDATTVQVFPIASEICPVQCECSKLVEYTYVKYGPPPEEEAPSITVIVKGQCWDIPPQFRTRPLGWQHGNIDCEKQEARYAKMMNETAKRTAEAYKGSGKKPDIRLKARIPRELFAARQKQFGKDYWTNEGTAALKRDNLTLPGSD